MRDTKSILLLLVSLLLVLVSFVLIWTWGYNFYRNNNTHSGNTKSITADSVSISNRLRDSLQKEYTAALQHLDNQLDSTLAFSDSVTAGLDIKLAEFYRLRNEIISILKNKNTADNYTEARQKIGKLQTKMVELDTKNQDVENENKKLQEALSRINKSDKPVLPGKNGTTENTNPVNTAFTATDLRLTAVMNTGDKEMETMEAEKADKINASFNVMNFNSQLTNAEMMVVVTGPDGRVLKNSGWDSGIFNTPDGKKVYSYKFNFNYSRGEAKRLLFSIQAGIFTKGNYVMEVYHNGIIIGRTVKTLG